MASAPLLPLAGIAGVETGATTAAWEGAPPRRLAALAIRRATEERVDRDAGEAALRLWDLLEVFAGAVLATAGADLLRVAGLLRVEAVVLDFVAVVAVALALLAGFALVAARLVRALGAALVKSATSVAGILAEAVAARRREPVGEAALALADARGLMARDAAGAWVERVRRLSTSAHSSSLREEGLEPWAWATFAARSISAMRFSQDVAKRLSDWDLAPLSSSVSTTPSAVTFLRRRLKISF
ncbi:MAG: hypothetical protein ACK40D_13095 [Cyanobacteriota bacterium]